MTHPIGMAGIFISYRRADSDGWAGRLRDALRVRFGDLVFQDVDNIADGEIFSDVIDRALNECDVALIIIGPSWGSARDEQGR
ncbi:MAG: toll/interleukin-1 receptor domain-containing protein, partial [Burkholderiales bacterium]